MERITSSLEHVAQAPCPWGPRHHSCRVLGAVRKSPTWTQQAQRSDAADPASCRAPNLATIATRAEASFPSLLWSSLLYVAGRRWCVWFGQGLASWLQVWLEKVRLWQTKPGWWERGKGRVQQDCKERTFSGNWGVGGDSEEWQPNKERCRLDCS